MKKRMVIIKKKGEDGERGAKCGTRPSISTNTKFEKLEKTSSKL